MEKTWRKPGEDWRDYRRKRRIPFRPMWTESLFCPSFPSSPSRYAQAGPMPARTRAPPAGRVPPRWGPAGRRMPGRGWTARVYQCILWRWRHRLRSDRRERRGIGTTIAVTMLQLDHVRSDMVSGGTGMSFSNLRPLQLGHVHSDMVRNPNREPLASPFLLLQLGHVHSDMVSSTPARGPPTSASFNWAMSFRHGKRRG